MTIEIGQIEAIYRYPVKSMRGERLDSATLGWHGLEGDRRLAFHRLGDRGPFPWLTAGKLPSLVCFTPIPDGDGKPASVRTPEGQELPLFGEALAADVSRRCGIPVEMMQFRNGIFDDGAVSVITSTTTGELCRLAGVAPDARRFRPNILVRSTRAVPLEEDEWVCGVLTFGDGPDAPAVSVTARDVRCAMLNYDPDSGATNSEVMKVAVRANQNNAGIYGTVTRTGLLSVGQPIRLRR
jgi:uncharacterized protein YcbX